MKQVDIRNIPTRELIDKYKEEQLHLQKLQFSHAVSPIDMPQKLRQSRRLVAKYLTEINARRINSEIAAANRKENNGSK